MDVNEKKTGVRIYRKALLLLGFLLVFSVLVVSYKMWQMIFLPSLNLPDSRYAYVTIPTGSDFSFVNTTLNQMKLLHYPKVFESVAKYKEYTQNVRPGRYRVTQEMSINSLINMLKAGRQEPVQVVFNSIRTPSQLAGRIGRQLEADSVDIISLLRDSVFLSGYGIQPREVALLFIPNTYEFFWNTSAKTFVVRMHGESEKFWNKKRVEELQQIGMTRLQAVTLASIVEMETQQNTEKQNIAGVYINRLKTKMHLQADPTLVFAHGDYSIRRVLNKHKQIDSPYNTYKYPGLPPGPICFPSIASIDAVLNYEKHDYLYFCARADFSGFHDFARTYSQHLLNARRYQKALNQLNIKK